MPETLWKSGDVILHTGRPEWGKGVVVSAESVTASGGGGAQRLVVRFDRAGTKAISTEFATLARAHTAAVLDGLAHRSLAERGPPSAAPTPNSTSPSATPAPFSTPSEGQPEGPVDAQALTRLPEDATDPFTTPARRLAATLGLYRFHERGSSLLDWAAMQTGLRDPLTRFSRHELEQQFRRFQAALEAHLKRVVKDVRRADPGSIAAIVAAASPAAQLAMKRCDAGR